ncbi:hypothetical protein PG994_001240 [Apiospora phragmitis]|uniref:Uncharacterized protein n=1 Tax=Apiospora phragmitis TaxID=2905665 RepID=A0ABR1WSZ0_9PEZI
MAVLVIIANWKACSAPCRRFPTALRYDSYWASGSAPASVGGSRRDPNHDATPLPPLFSPEPYEVSMNALIPPLPPGTSSASEG